MHSLSWLELALLPLLLLACVFDLRQRRIPNRLLAAGLVAALALQLASARPWALLTDALPGCALGLAISTWCVPWLPATSS